MRPEENMVPFKDNTVNRLNIRIGLLVIDR